MNVQEDMKRMITINVLNALLQRNFILITNVWKTVLIPISLMIITTAMIVMISQLMIFTTMGNAFKIVLFFTRISIQEERSVLLAQFQILLLHTTQDGMAALISVKKE